MEETSHIPEDELEYYSLGRLPADSAVPIEEHLLICEWCRAKLKIEDNFNAALKTALREADQDNHPPEPAS